MLDAVKKIGQGEEKISDKEWFNYFISRNSELETEYSQLVHGVKNRGATGWRKAGYNTLRDFFDGDQWQYKPDGGQSTRTYNFLRGVVTNYTAFMVNEPLEVDIPPIDITDDIEVARAEEKERLVKDVFDDNAFDLQFEMAVQNGSLLGDSIILGPFYNEEEDRIELYNVKKPENVRIIWYDDNYTRVYGFIHHYFVAEEIAYKTWGKLAEEKGVTFETTLADENGNSAYNNSARRMVKVMDCWTDSTRVLIVGNRSLKRDDHDWGFVPILHVVNMTHPEEPFGISDIEDLLDAQVDYNEKLSELNEIIQQTAFPWIFGKNLQPSEIQSGKLNLIDLGDEAEFMPDPRNKRSDDLNAEITRRSSTLYQLSGLNENIFGGQTVRAVTGRALSVLMQTVNNRIKGRQARWSIALKELVGNIFRLVEIYGGEEGKQLIGGYYKSDIFFPGTLLRNITDEINKFNAKLQSQETTMKNLAIPSPKDEKRLMKKEIMDKILMVELSRNPGLQLQIEQALQEEAAGDVTGRGPQLREDENFEDQPIASGGAPAQSSTKGAVRSAGQRAGASTAAESEGEGEGE